MSVEFGFADEFLFIQIRIAFKLGFALFVLRSSGGLLRFCAARVQILIFRVQPRERISLGDDAPYFDVAATILPATRKLKLLS